MEEEAIVDGIDNDSGAIDQEAPISPYMGISKRIQTDIVNPDAKLDLRPTFDKGAIAAAMQYGEILPTIYNGSSKRLNEDGEEVDWIDRDITNEGLYRDDREGIEPFNFKEQVQAFFETENTLGSYLSEEEGTGEYNRNYDVLTTSEALNYPELLPQLLQANNPTDAAAIVNNHVRETRNREIIDASSLPATFGLGAIVMSLDPVIMPAMILTGGSAFAARLGVKGTMAVMAGTAGTAETIAEIMKHDSQQLRTVEESFMNVGAAILFDAAAGGFIGHMAAKEAKALRKSTDDAMRYIYADSPEFVGAPTKEKLATRQIVEADEFGKAIDGDSAGAMKVKTTYGWQDSRIGKEDLGMVETGLKIEGINANPLVRLSKSNSAIARRIGVMLANSPMYYKGHIKGLNLTGTRGSVEQQKKLYIADHINAMNEVNEIYLKSRNMGSAKASLLDLTGQTEKRGELTYRQFQGEVGKALRQPLTGDGSAVDNAAAIVREKVIRPMMDDAIDAGVFDEGVREFGETYFPRLYDFDKLKAESDDVVGGFVDIVYRWLSKNQTQAEMDLEKASTRLTHHEDQLAKVKEDLAKAEKASKEFGQEYKIYKELLKWDIDVNDAQQVQRALKMDKRPLSMSSYIKKHGGIIDSDELRARGIGHNKVVGLVSKNGKTDEHWIQMLVEEGYYNTTDYNEISFDRFYNDLAMDSGGEKIYTGEIRDAIMEGQDRVHNEATYRYATEQLELDRTSTKGEIEAAMAKDHSEVLSPEKLKQLKKYRQEMDRVRSESQLNVDALEDFADMTPADLRKAASDAKANILGLNYNEFNEAILPDKLAFKASSLKGRKLTIDDLDIEKYLVNDADDVLDFYTKAVSPQIIVAREFGDIEMTLPKAHIADEYKQAAAELERKLIDEGASEQKIIKEVQKLTNEGIDAIKDIDALRDKLYGQYNRPEDPDSFFHKAGHFIKAVNFMRLLGAMTVSALPDMARPVMTQGFSPVFKTLSALKGNKVMREAALKEVKATGAALDMISTNMSNRFSDFSEFTGRRTKFERGVETMSDLFAKSTLMPQWNDMMKGFTGLTVQNEMARAVLSAAPTDRQIRELAKHGIGEDEIAVLRHYLGKYGDDGDLYVPNTEKWVGEESVTLPNGSTYAYDSRDVMKMWRSALGKSIDEIIVTPGIGEMPLFMSKPSAQIMMQFKSFPVSAQSRVLISGLQARDKEALSGLLMGAALGAMVLETKAAISGKDTPDNAGDYIYDSLDRAGFFGWLNEPIQIASKMTRGQTSPSRLWGGSQANTSRYAGRNVLGSLIGPTGDMVGDFSAVSGAIATGDYSEGDVTAGRKLLPFQNLFYFKWLLTHLQE